MLGRASVVIFAALTAAAEPFSASPSVEWPRFRGPNGSGVAEENSPPTTFGPSSKLLWKTAVPPGHSSPVVWNEHLFITAVDNAQLVTLAYSRRDGALLWRRVAPATTLEPLHDFNNHAAPTPASDGERVYVYFGSCGLLAYDFAGNEVWRHSLKPLPTRNGTATSPILLENRLILQRDGNTTESELLALDVRSGAVLWRTPRPLLRGSYSTPIVWQHTGGEEIVTVGTGRVVAYTADGVERWAVGGLTQAPINVAVTGSDLLFASATHTGSEADPIAFPKWEAMIASYDADKDGRLSIPEIPEDDGIVLRLEVPRETPENFMPFTRLLQVADRDKDGVVTTAEWGGFLEWVHANQDNALAIRHGGDGTSAEIAWQATRGLSEIPSPLFYRERLYFVRNGGMVTSYAADTGRVILDRQRLGALGHYVSSPVAADGRIYIASEPGTVVVFRAADTLEVLARNDLQESITATPAIADNKLYIRSAAHLWAFGD